MKRILMGALALLALGAAASAQVSIPNFQNQSGWHVGGLLEIISGGTFRLDNGTKTATATAGAATLSKLAGVVTTESLTTAAAGVYTLTLTNTRIAAADQVFFSISNGTNTGGTPVQGTVTPGAGSAVITVRNSNASTAFNGTLTIAFMVLKN